MKNNKSTLALLTGLLALCGCTATIPPEAAPNLRVGIISDSQTQNQLDDWGAKNTVRALEAMKERGVDVIVFAGDMADRGEPEVYDFYLRKIDEIFGGDKPELVTIMGNHDYHNMQGQRDDITLKRNNFTKAFGLDDINTSKVIKGYDFIALSMDSDFGAISDKSRDFMSDSVAAAQKRAPGKPIFVITHPHLPGTVYGSDLWGQPELLPLFADMPENVVHFSGHSHYPLEDERCIDQQKFTAIGTSTLNYVEMERGPVNGSVPPNARRCVQMIYMQVFDDHIKLNRIQLLDNEEIKPDRPWVLELPLSKSSFAYTAARAESRVAPEFPPQSAIRVAVPETLTKDDSVKVSFPAAKHDDFVHSYVMKLQPLAADGSDNGESAELVFFSDFYAGLKHMNAAPEFTLPSDKLAPQTRYRLEVRPRESFGKCGAPLTAEFTTLK